jgi:hypothetical protein
MQGMQDLQRLYSRQFTLCQQGSEMAAFPATFITGGSLPSQYTQIEPGGFYDSLSASVRITQVANQFNPAVQPMLMGKIEQMVDSLTGYGRLGTGEALPSGATAHEVEALTSTMNEQKDEYVDCVAPVVEYLWALGFDYFKIHYQSIKDHYGDAIKSDADLVDKAKIKWKLAGSSEGATSGQMLQKLMMAKQIVASDQTGAYDQGKLNDMILALLLPMGSSTIKKSKNQQAMDLMQQFETMQQGGMNGNQAANQVPGGVNPGQQGMAPNPSPSPAMAGPGNGAIPVH